MASDAIQIFRSSTGIDDNDFSLLTALPDGTPFSFVDFSVIPQQLYIYKARRYLAAVDLYSDWSPLVYVRAPWPVGAYKMPNTNTGIQSILGIGREVTENVPVKAQKGLDRVSGSMDITLEDSDRQSLQNIDTDVEAVPGISTVGPETIVTNLTPEGISAPLCALFGDPTTVVGGGTAPAATTATPSATGGTLPNSTQYYFKTAYVRPSDWGVTTASTEFSATTSAGTGINSISVASPATQTGATAWNLYAATTTGVETLLASGLTIGSPYVFTDPTLINTQADAAPSTFNVHTWKSKTTHVPHTLLEKRGTSIYAFPGAGVDSLSIDMDKTQTTPILGSFGWKALNQLVYDTLAAVGLDVAGFDPLPAYGASQVLLTIAGTSAPHARKFSINTKANLQERQGFNGKRGATQLYSTGIENTGNMEMYFQDEAESKVYFGQLDAVAAPYGAKRKIRTVSVVLTIFSETNAAGFSNKIIVRYPKFQYKKVGKPVAGKDAIMQSVDWKAYYDAASGTSMIIEVWNSQSNGTIVATGTPISVVPANDIS